MSLLSGSTPAAYLGQPTLLTGPDSYALQEAAQEMAMGGLCERRRKIACKECLACRQVKKRIHPDFIVLDKNDDVSIKALRGLLDKISRRSQTGRRMIILEAVERLSIPAVNALLKTLEEPAADTQFILTTRYPRRLPATLRSRVQIVRVNGQGEGEIDEIMLIARELSELLQTEGPSPGLRRAFLRLRDYYRIKSAQGNTKLARDVLRYSCESGKRL